MTNRKSTKRALLGSVMAMVLCLAMPVSYTHLGGKALDRAFSFLLWGNQEEERKSVHFCSINAKGMLIFIVADIWNCYNMV